MQPIPTSPQEALTILRDPNSEEWQRDYAMRMASVLEEATADIVAIARNPDEPEALQQRAAETLGFVWREQDILTSADISGFAPAALQEILFQRRQGEPFRGDQ